MPNHLNRPNEVRVFVLNMRGVSVVATIILLCGKVSGNINVSWFAVPFPTMLVLSVYALISAFSFGYVTKIGRSRVEGEE